MSVTDYTSHWFFVEGYGDHRDLHVLTLSFPTRLSSDLLDEAVFDLIQGGSTYFDPLKGFNQLDALDLANYSLLTRLIGRQKFEKKGAHAGGDGGADLSLRSVEHSVAYWNPALTADAKRPAQFTFTTPDNLPGWLVFAIERKSVV